MKKDGNAKCSAKMIALSEELWTIVDVARQFSDYEMGRAAWIEEQLWGLEVVQRLAKRRKIKQPNRGTWGRDKRGNGELKI